MPHSVHNVLLRRETDTSLVSLLSVPFPRVPDNAADHPQVGSHSSCFELLQCMETSVQEADTREGLILKQVILKLNAHFTLKLSSTAIPRILEFRD